MDGLVNSDDVGAFVDAISGLSFEQQEAVLSTTSLTEAQTGQILSATQAATATHSLTLAEAESISGADLSTIATLNNANATDVLTLAMVDQAVETNVLTAEQADLLRATIQQTAANGAASKSFNMMGTASKGAFASMFTTPTGWLTLISLVMTAAPFIIGFFDDWTDSSEELLESAGKYRETYQTATDEVKKLNEELETNQERIEELQGMSDVGSISAVDAQELEDLKEYNNLPILALIRLMV